MAGETLAKESPLPLPQEEGQTRKKKAPKKPKAPKTPKTTALRKMESTVAAAVDRSWVTRGATYPWDIGCKCDVCYLGKCQREAGDWRPVMPEINPEAKGVIFAENPGKTEILVGRPLFGRSGKETESGLLPLGLKRTDFSWDNAALCMPTGGDTRMMLADMARENRKRAAAGLPEYLSPFEACRPHVAEHVLARPNVLALGKFALAAVTGKGAAIRKIRGSMIDLWTHTVEDVDGDMIPHRLTDGGLAFVKNARVPGPGDLPLYPDECYPPNGSQRIRVVPTLHPAFVLREPAWRPVFRQDLSRFWNWINGTLQWDVPRFRFCPTLAEISNFLYGLGSSPTFAVDIETDGKDANYCNIRCIAIATPEGGIVIPFLGTQRAATRSGKIPPTPFTPINQAERMSGRRVFADWWAIEHGCHTHSGTYYTNEDARAIFYLLRAFLVDRTKVKIGHNFGYFDANVLIRELVLEEEPQPLIDTILFFRGCHSELYRDLFTLGTLYTHVPDWKAASDERKIAVNPRDDLELARYANTDTTVDARCAPMLLQEAAERKQFPAIHLDHEIQAVYRDANRLGMRINEPARKVLEEGHSAEVEALLGSIRGIVGSNTFNPFSTRQLTRLMFEDWKLPVLFKTDTGEPAADDDTLREFILKKVLDGERLRLVKLIRRLRKVNKELTTYILPWRAWNDYRRLKEATPEEVAEAMDQAPGKKRKRKAPLIDDDDIQISKDWKGGLTGPDGRIHANYNVHTARTGRASSSGPNFQNVQKWLRSLFIPEGGNTFVGADFDQIELRLVAALAGLDRYIQTIQKGGDPHALTAELLYGAVFLAELKASYTPQQWEDFQRTKIPTKASGKLATKQYIAMRVLAKTFIYAVIYGGSARTIYESVSSAEDEKTGELLFPDMTYGQIQDVYNNFMAGLPELPKWWQGAWDFAQANLYILEPILGRRRDFPSFERNEIPNMLIQGSAAAIMSRGLTRFRKVYAPNFALRRGIVNQCHDAAVVECGRSEAPWVKEALTEALTQNYFGMEFSAPAEQADDWAHAA